MDGGTTYDVRVYRTEVYKGSRVTTYKVRWKVSGGLWKEGFRALRQLVIVTHWAFRAER